MSQTSISDLIVQVPGLIKGLSIRSQNGRRLGRVVVLGKNGLEIQAGRWWRRRYYYLDYTEIISAFRNSIYIYGGYEALVPLSKRIEHLA